MNVFDWLPSCFSNRGKALSLYKRGMAKAKKHDHQGAIEDYTATIGMPHPPADLMAMLLYNRALVHVAAGHDRKGADDLEAVLAMKESFVNVKTMARQKLGRMESRSSKSNT
jgi:dihydroxyacid dehydratase/phosphogluconate dehydratase